MAHLRRGRTVIASSPPRTSQWVASADQGAQTVAAGALSILQSNATLESTTIVRTRGVLSIRPTSFGTDQAIDGAFGIGAVSDQAFAAGAASIPGPWTDADWGGWLVWILFSMRFEVTTDVGRLIANQNQEINSKAMRKVKPNETVVVVAESQSSAFSVSSPFRMLVKLS